MLGKFLDEARKVPNRRLMIVVSAFEGGPNASINLSQVLEDSLDVSEFHVLDLRGLLVAKLECLSLVVLRELRKDQLEIRNGQDVIFTVPIFKHLMEFTCIVEFVIFSLIKFSISGFIGELFEDSRKLIIDEK